MVNGKRRRRWSTIRRRAPAADATAASKSASSTRRTGVSRVRPVISALAKEYTTPNPEALMPAKQAGNISLQPGSGTVSLVIKNYVKQGDSMTMTISGKPARR